MKIIEISSCVKCPYLKMSDMYIYCIVKSAGCMEAWKQGHYWKKDTDIKKIPEWCPLEDKK